MEDEPVESCMTLVWRITKGGVLDKCMIEFPPLTDGNVRWLWPMREGKRIWLTANDYQIHKFPRFLAWSKPQSNTPAVRDPFTLFVGKALCR